MMEFTALLPFGDNYSDE